MVSAQGLAASDDEHVSDFSLADTAGKQHAIAELRHCKAVVLFFVSTECPASNGYAPVMQQLASRYAARGVTVYGVHTDPDVTAEQAAAHAKEYGLTMPILLDPRQTLARQTGARVTPESVVVTPDGAVVYRGRIDDRYAIDGKRRDVPTTHDLAAAIDAVLDGTAPAVSRTRAFGCPLPILKAQPR